MFYVVGIIKDNYSKVGLFGRKICKNNKKPVKKRRFLVVKRKGRSGGEKIHLFSPLPFVTLKALFRLMKKQGVAKLVTLSLQQV